MYLRSRNEERTVGIVTFSGVRRDVSGHQHNSGCTNDILREVARLKRAGQLVCGFSMETENLLENSKKKLQEKNLDLIVANNLNVEGAGFGVDTNVVTLISRQESQQLPVLSKEAVAHRILDELLKQHQAL